MQHHYETKNESNVVQFSQWHEQINVGGILTALNGVGSSWGRYGPDKSKPSSLLVTSK